VARAAPKPAASPASYHRASRAAPEPAATSATSHSADAASTPRPALHPCCGPRCLHAAARCPHAGRIDLQPAGPAATSVPSTPSMPFLSSTARRRWCREKGQREWVGCGYFWGEIVRG
jgi:hypothetical protein